VRIVNVFWDPMVGTYVDKRSSKPGNIALAFKSRHSLVILSALLFAPIPGIRGSVPLRLSFIWHWI
jgi:GPH family glycoside/pentoside/hexuronide:cation symporter